jgi:hypothetical protein
MKLIDLLECRGEARERRNVYAIVICTCMLLFFLRIIFVITRSPQERFLTGVLDFETFYVVGFLAQQGKLQEAYYSANLIQHVHSFFKEGFSPWTYPPQFGILVSLFSLAPIGIAYAVYMSVTAVGFIASLAAAAKRNFVPAIILFSPAFFQCIGQGQNGFLVGSLVAVMWQMILRNQRWTGLALGAMVIKPHLAITLTAYFASRKQWRTIAIASGVVLISSILAGYLFGFQIWFAFFHGSEEAGIRLAGGQYPLEAMVSVYASVRSGGLSARTAFIIQMIVTMTLVGLIVRTQKKFDRSLAFGYAALVAPLATPYAYGYDFLVSCVGFSLLMPCLIKFGTEQERLLIYVLIFFSGANSFTGSLIFGRSFNPSGITMLLACLLALRVLSRAVDAWTLEGP